VHHLCYVRANIMYAIYMTKVDNLVLQVLMSLLFSLIVVRDDDTVSQCYNNV
jgi:hypothetical protein